MLPNALFQGSIVAACSMRSTNRLESCHQFGEAERPSTFGPRGLPGATTERLSVARTKSLVTELRPTPRLSVDTSQPA